MGKINVYLPRDLEAAVKAADLNVSAICQGALQSALGRTSTMDKGIISWGNPPGYNPSLTELYEDAAQTLMRHTGRWAVIAQGPLANPDLVKAINDGADPFGDGFEARLVDGVQVYARFVGHRSVVDPRFDHFHDNS